MARSTRNARFTEARFTEARFTEARFTEARFTEARFTEARFTEARFTEARFTEARFTEEGQRAARRRWPGSGYMCLLHQRPPPGSATREQRIPINRFKFPNIFVLFFVDRPLMAPRQPSAGGIDAASCRSPRRPSRTSPRAT
ncbi:pentapeptide repeat-containing protein [Sorangium sp. So ce1151]|uniref:pentapeptide repeat-containing protein n=1 Tax=Sorangium sp. So ce1151 TaxID=3133332 RepID=UPI003F5FE881